jgi:Glycosyl transferase family 11
MILNLKLIGGLGNQLFQLVFACSRTDKLSIILENPDTKLEDMELYRFNLSSKIQQAKTVKFNFAERKIYNLGIRISTMTAKTLTEKYIRVVLVYLIEKVLQILKPELGVVSISRGVGDIKLILNRDKPNFPIGYYQNTNIVDDISKDAFNIEITNKILQDLIELAKVKEPIILQMRLGDYSGDERIGIPSLAYYSAGVMRFRESQPEVEVWLFSDDLELAKERANQAGIERIFTPDVRALSPAEILTLMRFGSGYVISNSTFGWWAAKLSNTSNTRVVVPDPWFRKLEQPECLIPNDWIKVPAWE